MSESPTFFANPELLLCTWQTPEGSLVALSTYREALPHRDLSRREGKEKKDRKTRMKLK
jgi:hypothetical protein